MKKCQKCSIISHVSKKHIKNLTEKLQFCMRELMKKEGIVSIYEEECITISKENMDLKRKLNELEASFKE